MERSWRNIAIALAGLMQSLKLVEELAKTGYMRTTAFETAINSLVNTTPNSTEEVFGEVSNLDIGAESLEQMLSDHKNPKNADLLRYLLGTLHLQKKLSKRSDLLEVISKRLEKSQEQIAHFGPTHDNVISNIAEIYTDTVSTFQYRIQVTGDYNYLQQNRVANQIRSLLLAAIRAATLWRQCGGSRMQLLFYRKHLVSATDTLRRDIKNTLSS